MTSPDGSGPLTTDELFRQHAGFVARFLSRLGVPKDQLDDALQEVFLVAHRNGGYKPGLAKPTSYLANLAIRAAAKHRRRDGLARQRHSDAAPEHMPGEREDPARALALQQDLERLQLALQRLPQELCTTLLLVEMEGESCVSVAAGLGCPVGTVYWRLHRARKQLRAALRAVDAPRRKPQPVPEALDARAQPARSWMIWFGLDGFDRSEAARLLQLAREQPVPVSLDELRARHHELVRAGAELPAWSSGLAAHSASWLSVLGAGPIAAGVVAGGAVLAASVLSVQPAPAPPAQAREPLRASASFTDVARSARPTQAVQATTTIATKPLAAPAPRMATALPAAARPASRTHARLASDREPAAAPEAGDALDPIADTAREPEPRVATESEPHVATAAARARAPAPAPEAQRAHAEAAAPAPVAPDEAQIERALSDEELAEMRAVKRAERLLADDPQRALALTRAMAAGFPQGHFHEERAYLELMALQRLGRSAELRGKGAAFLGSYPAGLYSERVRKALAAQGK